MSTLAQIRTAWSAVLDAERFVDTSPDGPDAFWLPFAAFADLLLGLPPYGVIVTPDSLARALHMNGVGCVGRDAAPRHLTRASVVLAAIAGDAS